MKKIMITTWCTDDWRSINTIENLINSLKYFHPDIDFYIFNTADTQIEKEKHPWLTHGWMIPLSCMRFVDSYDMTIHLDGDTIITGPLTELFESNEDIIGVRNMNSAGNAGAHNWGNKIQLGNIEINSIEFLNAGLMASNNLNFWKEWFALNHYAAFNNINNMRDEQGTLNYLFHNNNNKYTTKILDKVGTNLSYGQSNAWGSGDNHWESWEKLYIKNNQLCLDDPFTNTTMVVKVLHQAGGYVGYNLNIKHNGYRNWLRTIVSDDVNKYIDNITK
jgi:hypothetical protein